MKINLVIYNVLLISLVIGLSLPNSLQKVNNRSVMSHEISGRFMTSLMKGITVQIFLVKTTLFCQTFRDYYCGC